jgi:hypothetical protein
MLKRLSEVESFGATISAPQQFKNLNSPFRQKFTASRQDQTTLLQQSAYQVNSSPGSKAK